MSTPQRKPVPKGKKHILHLSPLPETNGAVLRESESSAVCCFTGHRVLPAPVQASLAEDLPRLILPLLEDGTDTFRVGGALGFDMLAAEAVLRLREEGHRLSLVSVLPFPGWMDRWKEEDRQRQRRILALSDRIVFARRSYSRDVYLVRDRMLVDGAGTCICYCGRSTGGTAYTVRYALNRGLNVISAAPWELPLL